MLIFTELWPFAALPLILLLWLRFRDRPTESLGFRETTPLRWIALILICLSLTGASWLRTGGPPSSVFIVDISRSVAPFGDGSAASF